MQFSRGKKIAEVGMRNPREAISALLLLAAFTMLILNMVEIPAVEESQSFASTSANEVSSDIAFVPITAYNTCDDRIKHLSCLKTVMSPSATRIPILHELSSDLCDYILREKNTNEAEYAHVDACLQIGSKVGGIVHFHDINNTPQLSDTLKADEIDKILTLLDDRSNTRVVDRSVIITTSVYAPRSKESEKVRERNDNKGNFIWAYGVSRLYNPYTTVNIPRNVSPPPKELPLDTFEKDPKAYIIATANLFDMNGSKQNNNQGTDAYDNKIRNKVEQFDLPTMMIGAGVQADFTAIPLDLFVQKDLMHDAHKQILSSIQQHTMGLHSVSVRGNITESACSNAGFNICVPLGCPSLTINRSLNLGRDLAMKWERALTKLRRGEKIRIGVTLPAPGVTGDTHETNEDLISTFKRIYDTNNDVFFILQTSKDGNIASEIASKTNIVSFLHVEDWRDFTGDLDIIISSRIHGGMAGILAGTPAVIVPTDIRIMELVNAMMLPTLSLNQFLSANPEDLVGMLQLVNPDFEAFERNRRKKLSKYLEMLKAYELEMDPELLLILEQDDMYADLISSI